MSARQVPTAKRDSRPSPGAPPRSWAPLVLSLGVLAGCTTSVSSVSPTSVAAAGPAFQLTVLGSGFSGSSKVQWNGSPRSTTYVSTTELLVQITATDIASTGSASITVTSPAGTGSSSSATSNAKTLSIEPQSTDATAYQIDATHDGAVTFNSVSFPSAPAWSMSLGTGTPSNIVIADGKVFLTTGTSAGSQLLALNQSGGTTAWGPSAITGVTGGSAGVAYDGGRVFVTEAQFGSSTAYAYDANTGKLDWSSALDAGSPGAPTAADGFVFVVATGNATLYALDEATGAISWQKPLSAAGGTPAVTADGIYVTSTTTGCHTLDLRPATGEVIWDSANGSSFCPQTLDGTPAVANQLVYSPDSSGSAIFGAETGSSSGTLSYSPPGAFTSTLAFLTRSPNLDAIALPGNSVQWTFNGDNQLDVPPVVVSDQANDHYVFTGSSLGNVYAIDAASGSAVWTKAVSGKVVELAVGDGLLLVVSEAGNGGGGNLTAYTLSSHL
jgi:outer membrane protein assembly factor BamB